MILITVGTHNMSFQRLLKALDGYLENGEIEQSCRAQIGYSDYLPRNYPYVRFYPLEEFMENLKAASVVITHAGGGVITTCLRAGKKMVVVPRLKKYGEHTNDHQREIARQLEEESLAAVVYDLRDLPRVLRKIQNLPDPPPRRPDNPRTARIISDFLTNLAPPKFQ